MCFTKEIMQKSREIAETCEMQAKSLIYEAKYLQNTIWPTRIYARITFGFFLLQKYALRHSRKIKNNLRTPLEASEKINEIFLSTIFPGCRYAPTWGARRSHQNVYKILISGGEIMKRV